MSNFEFEYHEDQVLRDFDKLVESFTKKIDDLQFENIRLENRIKELELENQRLRSTVNNQQALFGRGFL